MQRVANSELRNQRHAADSDTGVGVKRARVTALASLRPEHLVSFVQIFLGHGVEVPQEKIGIELCD